MHAVLPSSASAPGTDGFSQFAQSRLPAARLELVLARDDRCERVRSGARRGELCRRSGAVANPSTLTVIDYSKPSTEKRLWVFDLRSHELVYEELVAHGQGSGGNLPTSFSNDPETHRTSLGLFVTADTYVGKNGYSLRLDGLDRGFNDHARERAIVMHGAPYVSERSSRRLRAASAAAGDARRYEQMSRGT